MKIRPGALAQRPDRPERHVAAGEDVVAREVGLVEHVGEHERVGVGAVRRQEHERGRAIELAQRLERRRVDRTFHARRCSGPITARKVSIAGGLWTAAISCRSAVSSSSTSSGSRSSFAASAAALRARARTRPPARRPGAGPCSVADQRALGAIDGERGAARDEAPGSSPAPAGLVLELAAQLERRRAFAGPSRSRARRAAQDRGLQERGRLAPPISARRSPKTDVESPRARAAR